ITCIKRFINTNTNLVADEKDIEKLKKNNIQIIYLKFFPKGLENFEDYIIIGELTNAILAKSKTY
ncbi:MAG: hypothetical protein ACK4YF_08510, partial [Exilispira sp.]